MEFITKKMKKGLKEERIDPDHYEPII